MSYTLPPARRIVISNAVPAADERHGAEPAVDVVSETVDSNEIFGGAIRRAIFGTHSVPATNDGPHTVIAAPGSGIVIPDGVHSYFLELAPGYTTPMHRTVSTDYLVAQIGSPVLITPAETFDVVDGKGTYKETVETVCSPGEVVVQRGAAHAWSNRSDSWVRILVIVIDAKTQIVKSTTDSSDVPLTEVWLQ